ncbi:hypothetical protein LEN26_019025 [Aphanomyces euteiches]|nr:hypothetical protein LEN26_019025 [Aphanomyces euteiches]
MQTRSSAVAAAVIVLFALVLGYAASSNEMQCGDGKVLEFVVLVNTSEPLGMLLSEKLTVLSFVQDNDGRERVIEATGLVEIGDMLVGVNERTTAGMPLVSVVEWIRLATLPKKLTFRALNATRCVPSTSSTTEILDIIDLTINFVEVSQDTATTLTQKFYALASAFGERPACYVYRLVLADPIHACAPMEKNITGSYVVAESTTQCSAHQQALIVGQAGGVGIVLAQYDGKKVETIQSPPGYKGTIPTPVVMVSRAAALIIAEMVVTEATSIRVIVTRECEEEYKDITAVPMTVQEKQAELAEATSGDLVIAAVDGISTAEFVKLATSPPLPLGKQPVLVFSGNLCLVSQLGASIKSNMFVLAKLRSECSVEMQIQRVVDSGAAGVLLCVPSSIPSSITIVQVSTTAIAAVFVSLATFDSISLKAEDGAVSVQFEANNAYLQQYEELQAVMEPSMWPAGARSRHVLYHRLKKAMADSDHKLEALAQCYHAAEAHYTASVDSS